MSDPMASKGVDRAVARALTQIAAATPARPVQPAATPGRDPSPADVAAAGGLAATLAAKPPVDAERVQMIKRALQEGRYPIVPAKIADRMIAAQLKWVEKK